MAAAVRSSVVFGVGIVLFVVLPLVAWGVADFQGFVSHPVRLGYLALAITLQAFVALRYPHAGQNQGSGIKLVQRQRIAVYLLQVLSLAIVIAAPFIDRQNSVVLGDFDIVRYLGLVLFAFGFVVVNWAEDTLGRQFSIQVTIQEDHKLMTVGPYRFLRHPRYLGIIAFNLGLALIFRSWLALILVAVLMLVLLWRIHDEEVLMRREFGAEWAAYTKRSWRLIPYIY